MIVLYANDKDNNELTQVFDPLDFSCSQRLNDYDEVVLTYSSKNKNLTYDNIKEYNRARVTTEKNHNNVKTFVDWVVKSVSTDSQYTKVVVRSLEYVLSKKIVIADKSYTNKSVHYIVDDLLDEVNGREDTGITAHADCSTETLDLEVKKGTNILQILKTMTGRGYVFKVIDGEVLMDSEIGEDRTIGDNYYLFKRDVTDSNDRNILDWSISYDADTIVNCVIHKDEATFDTDATSITDFGRIEQVVVNDLDASWTTTAILANQKQSTSQVDVQPYVDDFFFSELGDKVAIQIDGGGDIAKYTGDSVVMEKTVSWLWLIDVTARLSTNTVYTPTLIEQIKEWVARVGRLELQ